jgi:cyclic dehypoxanthinyl futalosine synthase
MLDQISTRIAQGSNLTRDEALWLLVDADLLDAGQLADGIRRRLHPDNRVSFVVDRYVNYTYVCESKF